jgi:hypothetical protein
MNVREEEKSEKLSKKVFFNYADNLQVEKET